MSVEIKITVPLGTILIVEDSPGMAIRSYEEIMGKFYPAAEKKPDPKDQGR